MSVWGAIGSAVSNLASSVAPTMLENVFNKKAATKTYQRQQELRETAYQDTMADMNAAGLNPILAYSKGPTATPSTSTSSVSAKPLQNLASSALAYKEKDVAIKEAEARAHTQTTQAVQNIKAGRLSDEQRALVKENQTATRLSNELERIRLDVANTAKQSLVTKAQFRSDNPTLQKFDALMESFGKILGNGNSAMDIIKKSQ